MVKLEGKSTGFIQLCKSTPDEQTLEELFNLFFTLEEKEMLRARYAIIGELIKGQLSQREIAKKYSVSIAQITRGSNALKLLSPKLKSYLYTHIQEEKE
jgi:TrpR family trp operon transcriptional repressor